MVNSTRLISIRRAVTAMAALASIAFLCAPAQAQNYPYGNGYGYGGGGQTIAGTITWFDGRYSLLVRDQQGYVDRVEMHQGTVINPTGLTLRPGMRVTIYGVSYGQVLAANEIDAAFGYRYGPGYGYGRGYHPYRHGDDRRDGDDRGCCSAPAAWNPPG
ncbi:MAG: hypothetical protein ACYC8W_10855 [Candidatus Tyrphobacter sp.]